MFQRRRFLFALLFGNASRGWGPSPLSEGGAAEVVGQPDPAKGEAGSPRAAPADALLDELGRKALGWLLTFRNPRSGLVLDRARHDAPVAVRFDKPEMASIASTGYFLSLLPEMERLGLLSGADAQSLAAETISTIDKRLEGVHGLYYHFVDWRSGTRWNDCEVSVLDSAILLNGVMVASSAFGDPISESADRILNRANWAAFVHRDRGRSLLTLGSHPRRGQLGPADVASSEMAMAYFLATGCPNGVSAECWYATRIERGVVAGIDVLNPSHPLFTSYYGMGWHDLEGIVDRRGLDLFSEAGKAVLANIRFCEEEGKRERTYSGSEGGWIGISAGDSPIGYRAPKCVAGDPDGVVWPMTFLAALPWADDVLRDRLPRWKASAAWHVASGPFGLRPFRLGERPWHADDLIGIDVGSFAVSLANHRNRTVWRHWMRHPIAVAAYQRLGLVRSKRNTSNT